MPASAPELTADDLAWLVAQARRRWPRDYEDIAQSAAFRAWRKRAQYRPGSWRGWLLTLLIREGTNWPRCNLERTRGPEAMPEPGVDGGQRLAPEIGRLLRLVPKAFRSVTVLRAQGLECREIAERLGCPLGTVFSRLHCARRALFLHRGLVVEELT